MSLTPNSAPTSSSAPRPSSSPTTNARTQPASPASLSQTFRARDPRRRQVVRRLLLHPRPQRRRSDPRPVRDCLRLCWLGVCCRWDGKTLAIPSGCEKECKYNELAMHRTVVSCTHCLCCPSINDAHRFHSLALTRPTLMLAHRD